MSIVSITSSAVKGVTIQFVTGTAIPVTNEAKPPAVKPPAVKPPAVKPPAVKPPAVKPPAVKPPAVKPPAVKPPAVKPPAVKPPAVKPPAVKPPAAKPPAEKPPAAKPPAVKVYTGATLLSASQAVDKLQGPRSPKRLYITLKGIAHMCGLFNQMISLAGSIVMACITGSDLYVEGFQPAFDKPGMVPLNHVIDLRELNRLLQSLKIKSSVFGPTVYEAEIPVKQTGGGLEANINIIRASSDPSINLGPMFNMSYTITCPLASTLRDFILDHLPFSHEFTRVAQKLVDGYRYNAVHLRIEDDLKFLPESRQASSFTQWLTVLEQKFLVELQTKTFPLTTPLFIATSLKPDHRVISQIRKRFPKVYIKPKNWRKLTGSKLPVGREIDAIIDYLICTKAQNFVGYHHSTFSTNVYRIVMQNGGIANLIK
jgi:hypothetical protein